MLQASTLNFLKALKKNNNKVWFDAHRSSYEGARKDFENFLQEVLDRLGRKDETIKGLRPKDCIFRINRDIRFSKDKSPYKSNFGASIARGGKKSIFAGYYIHCEPGAAFTGGGLWMPMPAEIKKIRQEIDYNWDEFRKIIGLRKFKSVYGDLHEGEDVSLKKLPHGYPKDHPAADYLKLRSWLALRNFSDKELKSKDLVNKTADTFFSLKPLLDFLNRALEE
jgi:uncharacterized protein (TIGR02453 family)